MLVTSIGYAANEQITATRTIVEIHTYAGGATIVYTPADIDHGCEGSGATTNVHIDWTADDNMKAMYSLALTAYASKKIVGFGVNGCVSGNGGSIPNLYRIDVKD